MCAYWRTTGESFPSDCIRRTASALSQAGLRFARLNGGEPTQHPAFGEFVSELASHGAVVEVVSNGSAAPDKWSSWINAGLTRIQLSIDSHRADHADQLRGVPDALTAVCSVLRHVANAHPDVYLMLNCVLTDLNYYDGFLCDYIDYFIAYGVKAVSFSLVDLKARGRAKPHQLDLLTQEGIGCLSPSQVESFIAATRSCEAQGMQYRGVHITLNPFIPLALDSVFRDRLRHFAAGRLGIHIYPFVACKQPWTGISIIENGDCFPCLNTVYTSTYRLGNILTDSITDIFDGPAIRAYRQRNAHGCNASCVVCKDHQQNNYYWANDDQSSGCDRA